MMLGRASRQAEEPQKVDQAERPPTESEKKMLAEFFERRDARHPAPRVKVDHRPLKPDVIAPAEGEPRSAAVAQLMTFGTLSIDFYTRTFRELLEASCDSTSSKRFEESDVNGALAAMHGIAPRDEIEGMLAAQMVAVHSAAMRSLRLLKGSEVVPQQDSNGNLAVKLRGAGALQRDLHRVEERKWSAVARVGEQHRALDGRQTVACAVVREIAVDLHGDVAGTARQAPRLHVEGTVRNIDLCRDRRGAAALREKPKSLGDSLDVVAEAHRRLQVLLR